MLSARDERGVTLVIVALSMVALMGMTVLVVDVGGLLWARRAMVNGSDAAALSAAKACAMTNDLENPEVSADTFADMNVDSVNIGITNIVAAETTQCDTGLSGYVTVRYDSDRPIFFAGVLGADSASVVTKATAEWGGIGIAPPMPLVINEGAFQGTCNIPDVQPETTCYVWEDNDILDGGNFGFLDVDTQWDVAETHNCTNSGGDQLLAQWINQSATQTDLEINYPYATFVCVRSGNHSDPKVWEAIRKLIGQIRDFPINGTSPADGRHQVCTPDPTCLAANSQPDKYNIIGFAHMEIRDVITANAIGPQTCTLTGSQITNPMNLMMAGAIPCSIPAGSTFGGKSTVKATQSGTKTWTVTTDGIFSWTGNRKPSSVSFDYLAPATTCGGQLPPNGSGHCVILKWHGSTFTDEESGAGANFGQLAIHLCDNRYETCVDPGY